MEDIDRNYWFVGAMWGGQHDQFERFLKDGVWENGYEDKHRDLVRSIQVGDRIAVKAAYTRKSELPFENHGHKVSVMSIKAVGTVTGNPGDGKVVTVDWTRLDKPREWYFFTHRGTIWRVKPGRWTTDNLIEFTFEGADQDIARFLKDPFWSDRYGPSKSTFEWIDFYQAFADRLLEYKDNRAELLQKIFKATEPLGGLNFLTDRYADGTTGPLRDVCPFTVFGAFNKGLTDKNRTQIAKAFAQEFEIALEAPKTFTGIPLFNNQNSWLFLYEKDRQEGDIQALWDVFERSLKLADGDESARDPFAQAFDLALTKRNVKWNLTQGLFWVRPEDYVTLDGNSRAYIETKLGLPVKAGGLKGVIDSKSYLDLLENLETRFNEEDCPVHSFPELSLAAWKPSVESDPPDTDDATATDGTSPLAYSLNDLLAEGCFIEVNQLQGILTRLSQKKNLILQGPPGTGKTWLARKLAYALMGEKAPERVAAIQFHPNLSYEDFVRGWRPRSDGKLSLIDGPLLEIAERAKQDPGSTHVLVIEEINRGNPAQIFGEVLTLLEADKRSPGEALQLSYRKYDAEKVHLPPNLYVIGTMNIADRSLALVDLALRRRFAFVDLEPSIGERWMEWVVTNHGIQPDVLSQIQARIVQLNSRISEDPSLGPQFRIGHSYVTPVLGLDLSDPYAWFRSVVETEIRPLLEEYWFDNPSKAREESDQLLSGV